MVMIHEAGHFFAAKISGVRVDEFAFGFPPKLFSKKYGETEYVLNSLPIGGYVKIYGENGEIGDKKSFVNKNAFIKIFILSAGVIMNIFLAYFLVTISLYNSASFEANQNDKQYQTFKKENRIENEKIIIADVLSDSPAQKVGIKAGDEVVNFFLNKEDSSGNIISQKSFNQKDISGDELAKTVSENINKNIYDKSFANSITIVYKDNVSNNVSTSTIAGVYGLTENKQKVIGLSFIKIAKVNLTIFESVKLGFEKTNEFIYFTVIGFKSLFVDLFTKGELSKDISGPVGIVNMVGSASSLGFSYLLTFTAVLSISLAVFNILPFPALDGGRIVFVIYESITRKKISERWQTILNGAGFAVLILLMIVVTIKDLWKMFS